MIRLIALSLLCSINCAKADWIDDYTNSLGQKASAAHIPGYAVAIVETDKKPRIYTYGYTDKGGKAIDEHTVFRLASVSKTFTSTLVARLAEQGKIHWRTSITTLAPASGFGTSGRANLTLEHILSQSSGYMPNSYDNLIEANYSVKRVLNKLADLEPLCEPGSCYTYQNALFGSVDNYFRLKNSSYAQQLKGEIIQPLKMPDAGVGATELQSSDRWAKPHVAVDKNRWVKTRVREDYYHFPAAAGVNASIDDMVIWMQAMLGDYPKVVSSDTLSKLTTPHVITKRELYRQGWKGLVDDAWYGLGWRIYQIGDETLIYHSGWVQGYRAEIAFSPKHQIAMTILMNAESNLINEVGAAFWREYFQHQLPKKSQQTISAAE